MKSFVKFGSFLFLAILFVNVVSIAFSPLVNAAFYTEEEIRAAIIESGKITDENAVKYAAKSIYDSQKTWQDFKDANNGAPDHIIDEIYKAQDVLEPYRTTTTNGDSGSCDKKFLGMPAWYRGLTNDDCSIKSPEQADGLNNFIFRIAMNVIEAITVLVIYASVGFIIYGGFMYLTSQGSSDAVNKAKTTISNAIIGLILSIGATAIVNFVFNKIITSDVATLTSEAVINNILNTIYFVSGVIAVVMIIVAGFHYVTSAGDSAKITKAKNTITYAVVGIVVILLAFAITWFVIGRFI